MAAFARLLGGDTIEARVFDLFVRIAIVLVGVFIGYLLIHLVWFIGTVGLLLAILIALAWWGYDLAVDYRTEKEKLDKMPNPLQRKI